jgi:TRAP-type C4-dicarboxylate transport system substrate-binding protein
MNERTVSKSIVLVTALLGAALPPPTAAEDFRLTAGAPQSTNLPWIGVIQRVVVPESNARLAAAGSPHRIVWREAYGGSLYKWQNTLEAIEIGLADIGWVGALWEVSKMPLQNVTYNAPFVTDDLVMLLDIFNELHDSMPALAEAWREQNQIMLGASGVDTYHLLTTFPVDGVDDLRGRKILAPGPSAAWLEGTGAVAVNGGLNTYYTQIRTGVADGVLTILTGAYPYRIHEVAPYVTLVGLGAQFNGGLAMNLDTWNRLPADVQSVMAELGLEYSRGMALEVVQRYDRALAGVAAEGALVTSLSDEEKLKWINGLPDIAGRWAAAAERRGHPAASVLAAFMTEFRQRGGRPLRDWDAPRPTATAD